MQLPLGLDARRWGAWAAQLDWGTGAWLGWAFGSPALIDALRLRIATHRGAKSPLLASAEAEIGVEVLHLDSAADVEPTLIALLAPPPPALRLRWVRCGRRTVEALRAWRELHLRLNERRHFLMQNNPGGVIFAGPAGLLGATRAAAPDLWTVRSVAVELEEDRGDELSEGIVLSEVMEADELGDAERSANGLLYLSSSVFQVGDIAAAEDWLRAAEARAAEAPPERIGDLEERIALARGLLDLAKAAGQGRAAERAAVERAAGLKGAPAGLRVMLRGQLAAFALEAGEDGAVEAAVAALDALMVSHPLQGLQGAGSAAVWLRVVAELGRRLAGVEDAAALRASRLLFGRALECAEVPGMEAEGLRFALTGVILEAALRGEERSGGPIDPTLRRIDDLITRSAGVAGLDGHRYGALFLAAGLEPQAERIAAARDALRRLAVAGSAGTFPLWTLIGLTTVVQADLSAVPNEAYLAQLADSLRLVRGLEGPLFGALRARARPPRWADLGHRISAVGSLRVLLGDLAPVAGLLPTQPWLWLSACSLTGRWLRREEIDEGLQRAAAEERPFIEDLLRELAARPAP